MYIIILLMCVNIFICAYKSYKKGVKYALFDLIMLILFYVLFICISMFLDMFKFNNALIDIKIHFDIYISTIVVAYFTSRYSQNTKISNRI